MKIYDVSKIAVSALMVWTLIFPAFAYSRPALKQNLTLQSAIDYSVTASVSATTVGSTISVSWTAPEGHGADDFLRLANVPSQDNQAYWTQALGAGTSGSFNVTVPNDIARYEFRLFRGSDNVRLTESPTFVVNKVGFSVSATPLTITAGGQITATWTAPSGRPLDDRLAIVRLDSWTAITQQFTGAANPPTLTFDAPLEPGQYDIRYYDTNYTPYHVAASQIITVTAADCWVAGRVRNADNGEYLTGALVEVLQSGVVKGSSLTNSNGGYNIPLVAAGTYDVRVTADGFSPFTRSGLVLTSGETTNADFDLTNTGEISGSITRSGSGTAIVGANVLLKQGSTAVSTATTDLAGQYKFARLVAGTYSVEVQAAGFTAQTQNNLAVTVGGSLAANFVMAGSQASGNSLEYVYDGSGRLVGTKEQGILTKLYNYDATGNLLSITPPPATAPAILSFSPQIGPVGTQVVIRGINFDAGAGQNAVQFNGTTATISSFSTTELVVTVPVSATTGTISVTSSGGSATSSGVFTVGSAAPNQPPVVSGFSPPIGHPGDIITISGSNFESDYGDNDVRFGLMGTPVVSGTTTSLSASASKSSGKISVTTPYGTGVSQYEFVSVPATVDVSKVDFKGRTWFGNSKFVNIASNRQGVLTFEAVAGRRMSLLMTSVNQNVSLKIYAPDGKALSSDLIHDPYVGSWFVDTQTIPLTGTYTIVITPNNPLYGAWLRMTLYDVPPDVSGEMPMNSFKVVTFRTPGHNGNLTFTAQAGQKIIMNVQDNTYSGSMVVRPVLNGNPGGGPVFGNSVVNHGFSPMIATYTPDGITIPATGTYNIALDPYGANTGPMTISLFNIPPDHTYTMDIGSSEDVYTTNRGQNVWIDFDGVAGQRVSLQVRHVTYPNYFALSLNKPDGSYFATPIMAGNNAFIDTLTLPVTGRYKIYLNPSGYDTGSATVDLFNVPADVVATTSINGSPVTLTATVPGHNPTVTFEASQGQQARVNISAATVPNGTQVSLRRPDGGIVADAYISSGSALISSATLPVTGTYSVVLNPGGFSLGSATVSVGGDVLDTVTPGGSSTTTTISNAGQSSWLSFSGTAGQRISSKLTNVTISSGVVSIRKPDGGVLGPLLYIGSNYNFIDTVTLPTTGTYNLVIDPTDNGTGSATVNIHNVPADAAGSINVGNPQTKTTTVPGQNLALTLTGTANQKISLELTSISITSGVVYIYKPDGSILSYAGFGTTNTGLYDLVLPIAGDYQVYVDPSYDYTGSVTLQIFGTGTGAADPTVQLSQAVSVQKGFVSSTQSQSTFSVSVMKGGAFGTETGSSLYSSVSVMKGPLFGGSTTIEPFRSVSVTTGPVVAGVSPIEIAKNSSTVVTITGSNLGTITALRVVGTDQNHDSTISVTNINVNTEGTVLTATIQTSSSTAVGERRVVLVSSSHGLSQPQNTATDLISIIQ